MARLNITNSKKVSKKPIQLCDCDYGTLVRVKGLYGIIIDHYFIGQEGEDEIPVLNVSTGEVLFIDHNTPVKFYEGEITVDEEQFIEFK